MGTGLGHYIPVLTYLAAWVVCVLSLTGRPQLGMYTLIPLLPYRTMRDHFLDYPLGGNITTILVLCIILGALFQGRKLPKTPLYKTWLVFGVYLYFSMWLGTLLGNAPAPLWINVSTFATWKDYMLIPLTFVAVGLTIQDRKSIRTVIILAVVAILLIDRASLMDSLSRTFVHFDEDKRDGGPLGFAGSNGLAAFLAQFSIFMLGLVQFVKRKKYKLLGYGVGALTMFATMYCFSRAGYLAIVLGVFLLGLLKNRKFLILVFVFLFTWQAIVPTAVRERVNMTEDANGNLESSAEERVLLWTEARDTFLSDPVFGVGYATFALRYHIDNLRDTHNWYVKILVETGLVGMLIALVLLLQMLALAWRLFRRAEDPLYRGLGLGLFLCGCCAIALNFFGDRWTYIEITGLLWVLLAAAAKAADLDPGTEKKVDALAPPYAQMAYR